MKDHVPLINVAHVRQRVGELVKSMGISKTKLGEVLGGGEGDDPRVKINRASRFLSGAQKRVSLQEINALVEFFGKPIEWFLFDEDNFPHILAAGENSNAVTPLKPLEEIRRNLERMGFDRGFIDTQIKQLRAMEAYNTFQKNE